MAHRVYGKDFREDIRLDKFALDSEAEMNPNMLHDHGMALADAKAQRDHADHQVDMIVAATELDIRGKDPKSFGVDKYTEAIVKALVEVDPAVIKAKQTLLAAKEDTYLREASVNALNDKSSMIKVLQNLFTTGYYGSGPQ